VGEGEGEGGSGGSKVVLHSSIISITLNQLIFSSLRALYHIDKPVFAVVMSGYLVVVLDSKSVESDSAGTVR
jgi:hypothetical protein